MNTRAFNANDPPPLLKIPKWADSLPPCRLNPNHP